MLIAIGFAAVGEDEEEVTLHGPDCDIYIHLSQNPLQRPTLGAP